MFTNSEELLSRIKDVSNEIYKKTNGLVEFEEYIILPYYGNIILRFNINRSDYTLEELDHYEAIMAECVKDEFLIDFMGSVYKKVGLNLQELENIFQKCLVKYNDIELTKSIYDKKIKEDGKYLLEKCNLSKDLDIWEIQFEEEINLFILGSKRKKLKTYHEDDFIINTYEIDKKQCEGLIKATLYAKQNCISLVRALLEA